MSIYNYHVLKGLDLTDKRITQLLPALQSLSLGADQVVVSKGAVQHAWFHILNGLVGASVPGKNGDYSPVDIYAGCRRLRHAAAATPASAAVR